ncbi:pyridoxamine 5'-phosphate oxidase family protein [Actinopolymorpha sp. NPDC004070]|uniref:pyridoxamine 5'-phosphate oxidase family protein n=1 Tax=Actinopolymorpha sp. NPDC004070 TaxID=3154548 RepID=UPI0033AA5E2A
MTSHRDPISSTSRTRLRRKPDRGRFDRASIERILDEGFVCHVGVVDVQTPRVIPTCYGRAADLLYLHGSTGSTLLRALAAGTPLCVTVTLVDGLVLARTQRTHSVNYRSVVIYGQARLVSDPNEKARGLAAIVEHVVPGRAADVRPPNRRELAETHVLAIGIDEASAKVRSGPPLDGLEDLELPVWAGELPLRTVADEPVPDPSTPAVLRAGPPVYVRDYRRPGG